MRAISGIAELRHVEGSLQPETLAARSAGALLR